MTYAEKLENAAKMIEAHNEQQEPANKIDADAFLKALIAAGGTDDRSLRDCSFENLQEFGITAILLAKKIANLFRDKGEKKAEKQKFVSAKKAEQMSVEDLLKAYDPSEPDNPVAKELAQRSKGKRCIVFTSEGKVDVKSSTILLEEIKQGYPERDTFLVEGKPHKVYKIGQRPDMLADENPLYPGRKLYPDGTCDQTNRSWDGVAAKIRTVLYLAITQTKELVISHSSVHDIIDIAISEGAEEKICQRYTGASVLYDELKDRGDLPSLKLAINGSDGSVGGRGSDPLNTGHRTY